MGVRASFFLLLLVVSGVLSFNHNVDTHCSPNESICEFNWTVDYTETMIYFEELGGGGEPVVVRNGSLYRRQGCDDYVPIDFETDRDKVITGDGTYKLVYAINGQVPGPTLVAYEGQTVVVNLKNNLLMEGITIHWHGMVQWHTPWMDGVGTISHCPINPGETFQYRFLADPEGTHWYHSHLGTERTDGLSGALIILPKPEDNMVKVRADLPDFESDYVLVLSDWKLDHSVEVKEEFDWGLSRFSYGFNETSCYQATSEADGGGVGLTLFESGLMNGRGHHYFTTDNPDQAIVPELPLEEFEVKRYSYYRFRVANVGMMFAFRLSIDGHDIQVIAVDGNDVEMEGAESIVIHTGERVDLVVYASANVGNYWIRAETLEATNANGEVEPGRVLGVLHYQNAPKSKPNTKRKVCKKADHCKVINCPFGSYPDSKYIDCFSVAELKATEAETKRFPVPDVTSPDEFQEVFLNFHFSSSATVPFTSAVNGHNFITPSAPPQIYPKGEDANVPCDDEDCTDHCECTYTVKLEKDKTIQVVILNMDDAQFGMPHPIHMHGHHFHIVKIGYPTYNTTTGRILDSNPDIDCRSPSCNKPTWKDRSWRNGNIPGLNLENPPQKDTIIVPRNGYVVLRIKADNPGFWFVHCHIEVHQIAGMAVLLQEGEIADMAPVPEGFPTCGNFKMQDKQKSVSSHAHVNEVKVEEVETVEEVEYIIPEYKHRGHEHEDKDKQRHHGHRHHHSNEGKITLALLGLSIFFIIVFISIIIVKSVRKNTSGKGKKMQHWFADNLKSTPSTKNPKSLSESKQELI